MDAASKSEALGESWDSYTVQLNDAVVTLPCAAADLEAAGLKMDQSVTAEDQTVEIGEYVTGYYNDTAGNRLKVTLVNPSAEALPVSQCLIGSISVDTKALEAGGLTVQFPGGVQIGSLKEDVLKKSGNVRTYLKMSLSVCIHGMMQNISSAAVRSILPRTEKYCPCR